MKKINWFAIIILSLNLAFAQEQEKGVSISIETSFLDKPSFDRAITLVASDNYTRFMRTEAQNGDLKALNINTLNKLQTKYLDSINNDNEYHEMSNIEKAKALYEFASDYTGINFSSNLILNELVISSMVKDPQNWRNYAREVKDQLSFNDKLLIASHFGGKFGDDYNYDRADNGPASGGIVTIETMLTNLSNTNPGGVCRDVTRAQAQILTELGIDKKSIYNLSYATATGFHAVTLVQDPTNKTGIYKINYDYLTHNQGLTGPTALNMDGTLADVGTAFKVYDADGSPIAAIPSELGQIFREVTGSSSINTAATKYSIRKSIIESRYVNATLFQGKMSGTGDDFTGVALDRQFKFRKGRDNYEIGVAVISREGREREDITFDQTAVFARLKYWMERKKTINRVVFKGIAGSEIEAAYLDTKIVRSSDQYEKAGKNFDHNLNMFAGFEAQYTSNDQRFVSKTALMLESYIDFKNITSATSGGYQLVLNKATLTQTGKYKVNQNMIIEGQVLVTSMQIGQTMTFKSSVHHVPSKLSFGVSYHTPISSVPAFHEDAEKRTTFSVTKKIGANKKRPKVYGEAYFESNHFEESQRNRVDMGVRIRF